MDADSWVVANKWTNHSVALPQVHGWFWAFYKLSYDGEPLDARGEVGWPLGGVVQEGEEEGEEGEGSNQLHDVNA